MAQKKKKADAKQKGATKTDAFYIGIPSPKSVRRSVLESSKDVITVLKKHENIKEIRDEKARVSDEFNTLLRDIKATISKLKKILPAVPLRHKESPDEDIDIPTRAVDESPAGESESREEIDKLEAELHRIESKLSGL